MTEAAVVEGSVPFKVGRRECMLAPLSLRGVKRAMEFQKNPIDENSPEAIDRGVELILLPLRRNPPEVTADELLDEIDGHNLQYVLDKVMEVAGATPKAVGETTPST